MQLSKKKLVSGLFMLISCKLKSIAVINYPMTLISNIYNKFMQLPQRKTSFKSFLANFLKTNVYHYNKLSKDSSIKYVQ